MKTIITSFLTLITTVTITAQGYVRPHNEVAAPPTENIPLETGTFQANEKSLSEWECPEWFRDAKFGIWAHWGPQCQAEWGDWYARGMYQTGSGQYNHHVATYGSPSTYGFKEMCRDFTAPDWNADDLVKLYSEAGAQYFFTLGNHHDNYDLWDSPYQEWNSVNIGPGKDIVKGWADACKKYNLRFGISMHASHTWMWMEPSQDYDGNLTLEEGTGNWWEGYDPQALYAQRHQRETADGWHWEWDGTSKPDQAYMMKFQNRVLQCINAYNPDMLYFDDTVLPFWYYQNQWGLNILQHFYNHSAAQNEGKQQAVVMGKILKDNHKDFMLWDVERGIPDRCQELPWQTCTCIGSWHYDVNVYNRSGYKSAETVVRMLVDIVSKNGNMLLSVPINRRGTIDEKERVIVNGIGAWMKINKESIIGTRPWKTFGEGPLAEAVNPLNDQGFNEGISYSANDVRYVTKDSTVYATIMRWPSSQTFTFSSFSLLSPYYSGNVKSVRLLGYDKDISFTHNEEGLTVNVPTTHANEIAPVYAITFEEEALGYEQLQQLIDMVSKLTAALPVSETYNTGKYMPDATTQMYIVLEKAKGVTSADNSETIENAITEIRDAWSLLQKEGVYEGGKLGTAGANITAEYLIEASNFSRSDGKTTRFGTPQYWTVENFLIPQTNSNGTKNGIDKYPGYNCLMLGVWSGDDGTTTSDLTQSRIYRRITLPAGHYFFGAAYKTTYQMSSEAYVFAASSTLTTQSIPQDAIAYHHVNKYKDDGKYYGIDFTLEKEQEVCLGWQADLTQGSATQEFRVERVILVDRNATPTYGILQDGSEPADGTNIDITIEKLTEAADFSASTLGSRYGTPKNWKVENYNITNSAGNRNGIDKYPGYNCLSFGIWGDRNSNTGGASALANARIYKQVTLPAGRYYFGAQYETHGKIAKSYLFVADRILNTAEVETEAIACHNIKDGASYSDNDNWLGVHFILDTKKTIFLGWQGDLQSDNDQVEFRAKSVKLLQYVGEDITEEKLIESRNFSTLEKGSRYGTPQYWTVENYNITNSAGNRNGIDNNPGYNCLSLGIWNDLANNTDGDPKNARIYRRLTLDTGKYYFGAAYNTVYNIPNQAYFFAVSAPVGEDAFNIATTDIPTSSSTLAYQKLNSIPYFNSNKREEMYSITFTLDRTSEVCLGWQVDLTMGSPTKEFRASTVKLVCLETEQPNNIEQHNANPLSSQRQQAYDIQGRPISQSMLRRGIYIVREGLKVHKVLK